jgi:hypothetical protein
MDRLMLVMTGTSVVVIMMILFSIRRAHIRVEYSVSWFGAAVALLIFSRSHWLMEKLAAMLGISYPPLAILFVVLSLFLIVFYRFSMILSGLKDSNIALAQKVAILEFQIQSIHEEQQKSDF